MLVLDAATFAYPGSAPYVFSLTASRGEITAVEGRSGSGKSTLLDLVAGFLTPSAGHIRLDGAPIDALPPEQRPVSILFQSDTLFEHLTAAQNIALGVRGNVPAAGIDAALAEVGLAGFGPRRASTLSGGQKQRVALARTLLRNTPVLLLDEPFSALDDDTRAEVRDLVSALTARHDWITILVTHHRNDIDSVAARVYRLADNRATQLR